MIAEDFLFDTAKIKAKLGWRPTLTNEQMLVAPTSIMPAQRAEIHARRDVSAHSKAGVDGCDPVVEVDFLIRGARTGSRLCRPGSLGATV